MAITRTPTIEGFPSWATDEGTNPVERFLSLPDADNLKSTKLFGIPLKSALTNDEVPDSTITDYITVAISEIEHELDLYITPVKFNEQHDYTRENFTWSYNFTKLNHPNILEVSSVELTFSNNMATEGFVQFPLEHVHVRPQEGVIQLVPAFGTSLSGFLLSAFSGTQFHALRAMGISNFPGGLRIEYTAGFAKDKVPAVLVELIKVKAALKLLSDLGPVLFPHNSVSIGLDGLSQSTSNPGPQFLRNRMDELEKQEKALRDTAAGYYQRKFVCDTI